jgi:HupE/UreJ protein
MMSIWATSTGQDLLAFASLGIRHIVAREAADHILFLVALATAYRPAEWRSVLWVVTAFTVGHSISLALAVSGRLPVPPPVIELAIACTIMVTAIENLVATDWTSGTGERRWSFRYRPALAGVFGLVHGAGFAEYLRALFVERVAVPLAGFNVGIEIGQVLVLSCAAVALVGLDRAIDSIRAHASWWRLATHRSRVVLVSSLVAAVAARWVVARAAW